MSHDRLNLCRDWPVASRDSFIVGRDEQGTSHLELIASRDSAIAALFLPFASHDELRMSRDSLVIALFQAIVVHDFPVVTRERAIVARDQAITNISRPVAIEARGIPAGGRLLAARASFAKSSEKPVSSPLPLLIDNPPISSRLDATIGGRGCAHPASISRRACSPRLFAGCAWGKPGATTTSTARSPRSAMRR